MTAQSFLPPKLHTQLKPVLKHNGKTAVFQRMTDEDTLELLEKAVAFLGDDRKVADVLHQAIEGVKQRMPKS